MIKRFDITLCKFLISKLSSNKWERHFICTHLESFCHYQVHFAFQHLHYYLDQTMNMCGKLGFGNPKMKVWSLWRILNVWWCQDFSLIKWLLLLLRCNCFFHRYRNHHFFLLCLIYKKAIGHSNRFHTKTLLNFVLSQLK